LSSDDSRLSGTLIDVSVGDPATPAGAPTLDSPSSTPLGGLLGPTRTRGLDASRIARLAFACFLLAPLPWVIAYLFPPLNHDSAALLHFSQRWLAGERLYVDLIDVNPPLVFMLGLVPAAIARLTPMPAPTALVLCVLVWVGFAFGASWRLLRSTPGSIGGVHRYILPPLFLFLAIVYAGNAFSQREHLMAVALLPYLLLAQARWEDRAAPRGGDALAVALFAGLAFSLKPHFMLLPALVEGALLLGRGPRRTLRDPVPWILVAMFVAYAAFVALVTPDYLRVVVPLAMSEYRELGSMGAWGVLSRSQLTASLLLLLPLAVASLFVPRPLARLVALAAIGCAAIAAIQGKGWPYHVLPAEMLVLLLAAVLLCESVDGQASRATDRRRPLAVLLVAFMLGGYYLAGVTRGTFWRQAQFGKSEAGQLLARYGKTAGQGQVLVLSPGIYPHFPFVNYARTKMAMRFMSLWPIQGAYRTCLPGRRMFRSSWEMSPAEAFAWNAVAEDFNRARPRLVIVDKEPGIPLCHGEEFDYLAYFRTNPLFEAGWGRYQLLDEFDRYRVYIRR
jgi:hypothetical protein